MFRYSHKRLFAIVFFCASFHVSFRLHKQSQKLVEKRQFYPKPRIDYLARYKTEFPNDSAWFGLAYQNLYGRPYSDFLDLKFEQKLENWTIYFPELMTSLNKLNQRKQNTDFTLNTFSNSRVVIVDKRTEYKTGDILNARIDAYDWNKNSSSFGGDYFVARLVYGDGLNPDGIAGIVTDHRNGTYSIRVPLLTPGEARLEVRLMIPLEGIAELVRCTSLRKFLGTQYVAEFETKEQTECNVDLSFTNLTADEICDYSNPRNQEPWFCVKPPSGKCPKITNVMLINPRPSEFDLSNKRCDEPLLKQLGCNQNIQSPDFNITVSSGIEEPKSLPPCKTSLNGMEQLRPNGYFVNAAWKSKFCKNNLKTFNETRGCLENKEIYFLGDSTSRQYYYLFATKLNQSVTVPPYAKGYWHEPKTFITDNIRIYYRAHGPPLQNKGPPTTRPYVSDVLDEIAPGQHEVVIVFNLGLHIIYFEPSVFIQRMRGIRDAMLRLNQRRTNVRFIYRSQRVLNISNGWLAYRYNVLAREIFKNVENFFYFDVWDMSVVWPLNSFHPEQPYLEQEGIYLCNFICNGVMG
ncbi:NXPE family member 2-like [Ciona intestinalis]